MNIVIWMSGGNDFDDYANESYWEEAVWEILFLCEFIDKKSHTSLFLTIYSLQNPWPDVKFFEVQEGKAHLDQGHDGRGCEPEKS